MMKDGKIIDEKISCSLTSKKATSTYFVIDENGNKIFYKSFKDAVNGINGNDGPRTD